MVGVGFHGVMSSMCEDGSSFGEVEVLNILVDLGLV